MEKDVSSYCVQRLREDSEYMFRVIAENPVGMSEALESETVTVCSKFGEFSLYNSQDDSPVALTTAGVFALTVWYT